jgi:hypothetical protein
VPTIGFAAGQNPQKQFKTIIHSKFVKDSIQIRSDRVNAQIQLGGYLLVSHALKDQFHNSALSSREAEGTNDRMPLLDIQDRCVAPFASGGYSLTTHGKRFYRGIGSVSIAHKCGGVRGTRPSGDNTESG